MIQKTAVNDDDDVYRESLTTSDHDDNYFFRIPIRLPSSKFVRDDL